MKKAVLLPILILWSFLSHAQYAPEAFVTKWQVPFPMTNNGYPTDYINLTPEGAYHYELFKLDGNTPILIEEGDNYGAISFTILEEDTGTYVLSMIPDISHSEPLHRFMMDNTYPSTTHYTAYKLIELIQWGTTEWSTLDSIMQYTRHLDITATDIPNLNNVISAVDAFSMSLIDNIPNINQWDVSQFQYMQGMFSHAIFFNQNISDWNVANVTNMQNMFYSALSFNQDIGNWNVSNVQNMANMFGMATDPTYTNNSFNQDIGNWDVSNVTNMSGMFGGTHAFNQDISNWDVSNVENMSYMFGRTEVFNQDIGNWDVSNVTNMRGMFNQSKMFNQDIGNWDVSNVENMSEMFSYAEKFNQDISNWNVINVNNMAYMFSKAIEFDQDISNWNVNNVETMFMMFYIANAFNQNLGAWSLDNLENAQAMFDYGNMSCENYSLTLKGWSVNAKTANDVELGAVSIEYSPEIEQERNQLINALGWTIVGDALGTCTLPDDPIAIQELQEENIKLYPNPVKSTLSINYADNISVESIHIYNITGQKVMDVKTLNQTTLEVDHLKSGIYYVEIRDEQANKIVKKFIKL